MSKDNNIVNDNTGKISDMSMFLQDSSLAKATSIVNGHYAQGLPVRLAANGLTEPDDEGDAKHSMMTTSEPGILAMDWIPTPGIALKPTDPINRSGTNNYRKFRNGNWTQNYFDIADVSYYMLACTSVYVLYNYLGLIYKSVQNVERENLYSPQSIVEALGCNYGDMRLNQAKLLFMIKNVERKISIMAVPKSFGVAKRWLTMTSHIYKDRDIEKAQYILFNPKYLLKYNITTGKLEYIDFKPTTLMTVETLESKVNEMLDALYPDEEMMRFNADVTNYITKDVFTVHDLDWNDMTTPIYDPGVLDQLHNADFVSYTTVTGLEITQVITDNYDSIIKFDPEFTSSEIGALCKRFIDVKEDQPSTETTYRVTRWKFIPKLTTSLPTTIGGTFKYKIKCCGTELLSNPTLYIFDSIDMGVKRIPMTTFINAGCGQSDIFASGYSIGFPRYNESSRIYPHNNFGTDWNSLVYLSKFNEAPIRYVTCQNTMEGTRVSNQLLCILGEVGNIIIIEDEQLDAIHRDALQSAFGLTAGNESIR